MAPQVAQDGASPMLDDALHGVGGVVDASVFEQTRSRVSGLRPGMTSNDVSLRPALAAKVWEGYALLGWGGVEFGGVSEG